MSVHVVGGICKQKRAPRWNEIIASLSTATMPGSTPKASGSANGTRKLSGGTDGPTENAKMRKINPVCTFSESISLPEHGNMQVRPTFLCPVLLGLSWLYIFCEATLMFCHAYLLCSNCR